MGQHSYLLRAGRSGDQIPVGERFSAPIQTGTNVYQAFSTMVTGSFPEVKRSEHGVDHPPHLTPRLKKEYSYKSIPLWAFMSCSRVKFAFTFVIFILCYSFRPKIKDTNNDICAKTFDSLANFNRNPSFYIIISFQGFETKFDSLLIRTSSDRHSVRNCFPFMPTIE